MPVSPTLREVLHRDHEGGRVEPLVALCRQPRQRRDQQRAADAVAHGVDGGAAGDVARHVGGRQRAQIHVVLEGDLVHRGVRVLPGDDEDREALLDQMADHAVLRLEVEDVVLVDPGRHDHDRHRVDRLGGRLVLDQLDQAVAVDHLARRHGHVAARREGRGIDHGETALLQVAQQVLRPGGEAGSSRLHGFAQCRRIGQQQQGRAHGGDELLEVEIEALPLGITAGFDRLAVLEQPVRGQQVHLLEGPVDRVLVPFRGREALVAALLRVGRRRFGEAPPALAGLVPVGDRRLPEPGVEFGRRAQAGAGAGQRANPDGAQRAGDLRPVHRHDLAHRVGVPHLVDRAQQRVAGQDLVELPASGGQHVAGEIVRRHLPPGLGGAGPVLRLAEVGLHP